MTSIDKMNDEKLRTENRKASYRTVGVRERIQSHGPRSRIWTQNYDRPVPRGTDGTRILTLTLRKGDIATGCQQKTGRS